MGQQQLLLLVLGVIIVGIAVVAGIGMFNASAEESAKDEGVAQLLAIGANAQQWFKKPLSMGGGGGSFANYVIPTKMTATSSFGSFDATGAITAAGYAITSAGTATGITFTATPNSNLGYTWTITCSVTPTNIVTNVVGATP